MINFEEELRRFSPMQDVNQAEDAIYNNDLRDISDIVFQVTEEMKKQNDNVSNRMVSRVRR